MRKTCSIVAGSISWHRWIDVSSLKGLAWTAGSDSCLDWTDPACDTLRVGRALTFAQPFHCCYSFRRDCCFEGGSPDPVAFHWNLRFPSARSRIMDTLPVHLACTCQRWLSMPLERDSSIFLYRPPWYAINMMHGISWSNDAYWCFVSCFKTFGRIPVDFAIALESLSNLWTMNTKMREKNLASHG
jgi:hypothetical protein